MSWKTLDQMALNGKRVLTRVDINVPVQNGLVGDTTRIERIVPTVQHILQAGGTVILLAHFGRPKGQVVPEMSLAVTIPALEQAFASPVHLTTLDNAAQTIKENANGIVLIENIRFEKGEEQNAPALAGRLADLGDVYCNDAFSAAHRAHASTTALAALRPACAGRLMEAELRALEAALSHPQKPVAAVVGGAKVSTKLVLLENLIQKVDTLIIGGGMANTFLAAKGYSVGLSLCESDMLDMARAIMNKAQRLACQIVLPIDVITASALTPNAAHICVNADGCPADMMILDAGPKTVAKIGIVLEQTRTLVWNGPFGAFETPPFDAATCAIAQKAAQLSKQKGLVSVAGGGDTVAALKAAHAADDFTYISTAGGAFLEWLEGKELPGIEALKNT